MRNSMAAMALTVLTASAGAVTVQPLTFNVFYDSDYPACCGVFSGDAIVASFATLEFSNGFAEFDLAGAQVTSAPLYLSFVVGSLSNESLLGGTIVVDAYTGNNSADRLDVTAPRFGSGPVATFDFGAPIGTAYRVDVTDFYNAAVLSHSSALGIRFAGSGPAFASGAVTASESLGNVALSDLPAVPAVPEPSAAWLLLAGLLPLAARRRLATRV